MESVKSFTPDVYKKLMEAVERLPKEAIERAPKEITRKGYDTTGYQYQFLVNVLNEVVGCNCWEHSYKILKEIEGQWTNGKKFWEITIDFNLIILGTNKSCVGGHKSEMYSDALKGAITNAFKKTAAWFGIGGKAYEGTIDDDYRQPSNDDGNVGSDLKPTKQLQKKDEVKPYKQNQELKESDKSMSIGQALKLIAGEKIDRLCGVFVSAGSKNQKTKALHYYYLNSLEDENIKIELQHWDKLDTKPLPFNLNDIIIATNVVISEYKDKKNYTVTGKLEVL